MSRSSWNFAAAVVSELFQTVEGFFGNIKNGIAGNYHGVSAKWLQGYLGLTPWVRSAACESSTRP